MNSKKREVSGNLSVAVDALIFTVADNHVEVLLEKRDDEPFRRILRTSRRD